MLISDIRKGELTGAEELSAEAREKIAARLIPDEERAEELEKAFGEMDSFDLKKIWPKLQTVAADGTGSYVIYREKSLKYMQGISYSNAFLADEYCMYGSASTEEGFEDAYELALDDNFYEFEEEDGSVVLAHKLNGGKKYRVIVSTAAGLYRYRTDMYIQCARVAEDKVLIRKLCPAGHKLAGLLEEDVLDTVRLSEEKYGLGICDFSLVQESPEGDYTLVMEPETQADNTKAKSLNVEEVSAFAQDTLNSKGRGGMKVKAFFCEPESFFLHRDIRMLKMKVLPDGICPQHMVEYGMPRLFKDKRKDKDLK